MAAERNNSPLTLVCILVTILLDMVGYGIIVPVLPELIKELTGGGVAEAAVFGGWLVFVYASMQFIFSPVLGNLSRPLRPPAGAAGLAARAHLRLLDDGVRPGRLVSVHRPVRLGRRRRRGRDRHAPTWPTSPRPPNARSASG